MSSGGGGRGPARKAQRFSDDPWESRVASLEQALVGKNKAILRLQEEAELRERRLRTAVARLREAEQAIESQAGRVMMASEGRASAPPAPDALAKLAEQKGVLEAREKQLRQDRTRLMNEQKARERTIAALRRSLEAAKTALHDRDRRIAEQQRRVHEAADRGRAVSTEAEDRVKILNDELSQASETLQGVDAARKRAEGALSSSHKQGELYRKNLLQAEETIAQRERELSEQNVARKRLEREVARLVRQLQQMEGERDEVTATRSFAERLGIERARTASRLVLLLERSRAEVFELSTKLEQQVRAASEREARAASSTTEIRAESERLHSEAIRLRHDITQAKHRAADAEERRLLSEESNLALEIRAARSLLEAQTHAEQLLSGRTDGDDSPGGSDGTMGSLLRWIRRDS